MENSTLSPENILNTLDEYLHRNDYVSAEKHLLRCLSVSQENCDGRAEILIRNELMGLYRKLGRRDEALETVKAVLEKIKEMKVENQVGSATTYLNSATVYKAFSEPEKSLELFRKAREIYESQLPPDDERFGGLYNNMALTLVDLKRFNEADELYKKAISIVSKKSNGAPDVAITYLNMANAAEAQKGIEQAHKEIEEYLKKAEKLLNSYPDRDGYYAFVCEKCASVFGYYGYFLYENELKERAKEIYERN